MKGEEIERDYGFPTTCLSMTSDRQTTSFIENSTEAGILLGGNGILHAMMVALSRAFRMQPNVTKVW